MARSSARRALGALGAGTRFVATRRPGDRWLAATALLTLVRVEVLIRRLPLPRVADRLGIEFSTPPSSMADLGRPPASWAARRRDIAAGLLDVWPYGTGPCLRESLVLGHLLRRERPVLRLGVQRPNSTLEAHAWVELAGQPVNDPQGFRPVSGQR
jgi:hypothetical protein